MGKKNNNKNKGLKTLREIKYWLIRNSVRGNCWVVLNQLDNMLSHPGQNCFDAQGRPIDSKEITLSKDNMKYVYSVYLTKKTLVALVEAKDGSVYIVRNKNRLAKKKKKPEEMEKEEAKADPENTETGTDDKETEVNFEDLKELEKKIKEGKQVDEEQVNEEDVEDDQTETDGEPDGEIDELDDIERIQPVKSTIVKANNLVSAINDGMSKSDRNLLCIQKTHKMSLKKVEKERLKEILAIDFTDYASDKEGMLSLWNKFLKERKDGTFGKARSIDLSGHFNLTEEILEASELIASGYIREIVFYQNIQINRFDWLKRFPNLKTVSFWYCYQLKNESIEEICKHCPKLESMNIHNCYQINNRVMLPLLGRESITKICLDNRLMLCQTNPYQGVITHKEWESVNNHSLEYLFVNSDNLTNDVIDNLLRSCLSLKKFLMNTLILRRLKQNLEEGLGPEEVTFQSTDDLKVGFKAKRDFKIKNLLKDQYEAPFSESMTKLIQEQREYDSAYEGSDNEGEEGTEGNSEGTNEDNVKKERVPRDPKVDPRQVLEEELMKEIEEEFRQKFGEEWVP